MATDSTEPEIALITFFDAMHRWELESRVRSKRIETGELDPDQSHQESLDELKAIFDRFCLGSDSLERGIRYQHPPEYNSQTEQVVALNRIGPDLVEVLTQQTDGWKYRRVFTLRLVDGQWRVAGKHRIGTGGNRLEESI